MTNISQNNKRVAKNTIALYCRMFMTMCIGLYTSRAILSILGISDYGLYNVVGGVVTMFGFLNNTLATSTQRFLNFELGKKNYQKVKDVFSTAFLLHLLLVIVVIIIAETIGLWYVLNVLKIEPGRETAAILVYHTSVIVLCIQIIQLPFMSTIVAHEKMNIYAYVSVLDALLKLLIIYLLKIGSIDKLILYGTLYMLVQFTIACTYNIYCRKNFDEARFAIKYDKPLFRIMLKFSSWNLIGGFSYICNSQGINLLINAFWGTTVNAARGISFQVNGIVNQFVSSFQVAVKPQVIKYYANGEKNEMINLVFSAAKYSALLLMIINIPLIVEIRTILKLWLGVYPDYTPIFLSLILFRSIITSMTGNLLMVVHATGKLKEVSIYSGLCLFFVLPVGLVCLYFGMQPYCVFIVNIIAALGDAFFELYWMNKHIKFPIFDFYKRVYGKVFPILFLLLGITYFYHLFFMGINEYVRLIIVSLFSIMSSTIIIYNWGLDSYSRDIVKEKLLSVLKH